MKIIAAPAWIDDLTQMKRTTGPQRACLLACRPGAAMPKFQKTRNPAHIEIERRAAELSAAGYPLPEHDIAMDAESIIRAARLARKEELASDEKDQ
jgi:hypothetical protein